MAKLIDCRWCSGTGEQSMETTVISARGTEKSVTKIGCNICKGSGKLTKRYADQITNITDEFWCKCSDPHDDFDFYDDGEHPDCSKHHYRCKQCGKVFQVG